MIRILVRAGLTAAIAALALIQLQGGQRLLIWELVLIGTVVLEMRAMPRVELSQDGSLFDFSKREPVFLPRVVSAAELTVVDALSGHLGPDRRLQPMLRRIAAHRLQGKGIDLETGAGADALGEREWSWLTHPTGAAPDTGMLESVVASLEDL
ncbi:MAG: hypothetical protein ACRDZM_05260 [Acidimicrobiia bacterium]